VRTVRRGPVWPTAIHKRSTCAFGLWTSLLERAGRPAIAQTAASPARSSAGGEGDADAQPRHRRIAAPEVYGPVQGVPASRPDWQLLQFVFGCWLLYVTQTSSPPGSLLQQSSRAQTADPTGGDVARAAVVSSPACAFTAICVPRKTRPFFLHVVPRARSRYDTPGMRFAAFRDGKCRILLLRRATQRGVRRSRARFLVSGL
jgi:hypothetical protein